MCSVSVIDNEITLMKSKIKNASKSEKDFYNSKIEMLDSQKNMLIQKVQLGICTQDAYINDVNKYLAS